MHIKMYELKWICELSRIQIYLSVIVGLGYRGTFRAINFKCLSRRSRYELEDKVDQREVKLLIARARNVGRGRTGLSGPNESGILFQDDSRRMDLVEFISYCSGNFDSAEYPQWVPSFANRDVGSGGEGSLLSKWSGREYANFRALVEWKRPKLFQFLASKGISDKHGRAAVIKSTQSRGIANTFRGERVKPRST